MTEASSRPRRPSRSEPPIRCVRSLVLSVEVDTRLLGMIGALVVIWIGFNIMSGGLLPDAAQPLEPVGPERVRRDHGDRHGPDHRVAQHRPVGRLDARASLGYTMAHGPGRAGSRTTLGLGFDQPYTWIIALAVGIALGRAHRRRSRASSSPTSACPSFIVTLGGLLVWRGLVFEFAAGPDDRADGQDLPAARRRARPGPLGEIAELDRRRSSPASRIVYSARRQPPPAPARTASRSGPMWAEVTVMVVGCGARRSAPSGSPTTTSGRRASPRSTRRRTASPSRPAAC